VGQISGLKNLYILSIVSGNEFPRYLMWSKISGQGRDPPVSPGNPHSNHKRSPWHCQQNLFRYPSGISLIPGLGNTIV
jgi:hypothetical protein